VREKSHEIRCCFVGRSSLLEVFWRPEKQTLSAEPLDLEEETEAPCPPPNVAEYDLLGTPPQRVA